MQHHALLGLGVTLLVAATLGTAATIMRASASLDAAAVAHVRAAAAAARDWYRDPRGGNGSYRGLTSRDLAAEAPSVSSRVHVTVLAGGAAYCLDDEEGSGHAAYYIGGDGRAAAEAMHAVAFRAVVVHSQTTPANAVCSRAA